MNIHKNVVIKKVCHSRKLLSGIYNALKNTRWGSPTKTLGDDANEYAGMTANFTTTRGVLPQGRYAGYSGRTGFTLIELLVVVLIIGILAAVAVPQYQKAVEKSRATQALMLLKALAQADQVYYLANDVYATEFDQLDVELSEWTGTEKWVSGGTDVRSNQEWSLQLFSNAISMGRISGPYAGTGFRYYFKRSLGDLPLHTILCHETKSGGITFDGNAGDYCHKIMGGTKLQNKEGVYTLPY